MKGYNFEGMVNKLQREVKEMEGALLLRARGK
jgi:hypothetical protein